jgi:hypothetical protein
MAYPVVVGAKTGKLVANGEDRKWAGNYGYQTVVLAGAYVFSLNPGNRIIEANRQGKEVFKGEKGVELFGLPPLPSNKRDADQPPYELREVWWKAWQDGILGWYPGGGAHGHPYGFYGNGMTFHGGRMYVRTRAFLFCIGDPKVPYRTPAGAPPEARVP